MTGHRNILMGWHKQCAFRTAILAVGIGLTVLGIYWGELSVILQKAVVICLECIGIG